MDDHMDEHMDERMAVPFRSRCDRIHRFVQMTQPPRVLYVSELAFGSRSVGSTSRIPDRGSAGAGCSELAVI